MVIFRLLNLNERACLRATCKRFRWLCDLIKICKLIIFERQPPHLNARLDCTDEDYAWPDTAYVTQMDALFSNQQLMVKQMGRFLRTLVIYGSDQTRASLEHTFEQLENLELHNIDLKSAHLLQTTSIRHFSSNYSHFCKPCEVQKLMECLKLLKSTKADKQSRSSLVYGFDQLKSKNIVRLTINSELESKFFVSAVEQQLFGSLQHLDVVLEELGVLPYLSAQCPNLRRVDCLLEDLDEFLKTVTMVNLRNMVSKLRDDLEVRLFGFALNNMNNAKINKWLSFLIYFLETFREVIRVNSSRRLCLHLDKPSVKMLKELSGHCDLNGFFALVSGLHLNDQEIAVDDGQFLTANFANCREMKFESIKNPVPAPVVFKRLLDAFSHSAKEILIRADAFDVELDNAILDNLAACQRVEILYFEIWNCVENLNFLLKLSELHSLYIFSYLPVRQSLVAELITSLRYLKRLQIVFVKPTGLTKQALKAFKEWVIETNRERFAARDLTFRVEIRTRNCGQIVRYLLVEKGLCGTFCNNEDNKMFDLIQFKAGNLSVKQDC